MPQRTKPPKPQKVAAPTVVAREWVLVRMPHEDGKPDDRYAVVEVEAQVAVGDGKVITDGLPLAYARKEVAIQVSRDSEKRLRHAQVFES